MATIGLPDQLPAVEEMDTTAARVTAVVTNVRSAATTTSDTWSATSARGVPGDFSGATAQSAGYAFTLLGRQADLVTAALERGTRALDVYAEQVGDLTTQRDDLEGDSTRFNARVTGLRARIDGSGPDADAAALESEAAGLREQGHDLRARNIAFWTSVEDAEDRLVAALGSVDSDDEAATEADRAGRPDVPSLLAGLAAARDPGDVNDWWKGLTPEEQEALTIHSPDVVGNTDGIPTGDRDGANRSQLEMDEEHLTRLRDSGRELSDAEKQQLANVQSALRGIKAGETTLDPSTGLLVETHLVVYRSTAFDGDGAVAISYGDPDTAENTAVVVPGLNNDGSDIASQGEDALNLLRAAGGDTAVIAWMGYDAPSGSLAPDVDVDLDPVGGVGVHVALPDVAGVAGVAGEALATRGGVTLSHFVDGLRATHEGDPANLTVIGHSYGSTTAAHAASDLGLDADSLTLLGSPGAGSDAAEVGGLNMPEGRVYVGSAEHDPVTWLGGDTELGLGQDPSQADFGAVRIDVDDGRNHHVDEFGRMFENHTSYFDPEANPQSVDNLGAIIRGEDPGAIDGRTDPARDRLADYAADETDHWVDQGLEQVRDGAEAVVDAGRTVYDDTIGRLPWP
jgi:pimeloyl-ACP methyl ester carboxylesterase